ncbi:hypothetical protein GQ54DRAFT_166386 [Martensiomyces pterosporus]|nr:hypothetical protein GQ54DRAFT_166386 [Martensiomyces pterosporus]
MEVRLDDFSSSEFDVKDWLNSQFASLSVDDLVATTGDGGARHGGDGFAQKLTTQLHFLATNSQQGNDRIKARFRHQAPQIARDIAALGKLVQDTQAAISGFSKAMESQVLAENAVGCIVDIDTARRQMEQSVDALEYLRSYTNLPQKIQLLIDKGELAQAWDLVDKVKSMCTTLGGQPMPDADSSVSTVLDARDAQRYEDQVRQAATEELCSAAASDDAEAVAAASRLLEAHGHGDVVESSYTMQRAEIGAGRLQALLSGAEDDDISSALNFITDAIPQERALIEAVGLKNPEAVLERLMVAYFELLQTRVRGIIAACQHNGASGDAGAAFVVDLYQSLIAFYSDAYDTFNSSQLRVGESSAGMATSKSDPLPRSLCLLFSPFQPLLATFIASEIAEIRRRNLERLQQQHADYGSFDTYTREISAIIRGAFTDIEQVLERAFAVVPASKIDSVIAEVAKVISAIAAHLTSELFATAKHYGIPAAALENYSDLAPAPITNKRALASDIYQPLSSEGKLEAVSGIVEFSLLGRLLDSCASACSHSVNDQWSGLLRAMQQQPSDNPGDSMPVSAVRLLLSAYNESCSTLADMDSVSTKLSLAGLPSASKLRAAPTDLSRSISSAIVFALTGSFRLPLSRLPTLGVWQARRESRSNMNIEVPQFSCSPSEEAVEIGEKMHVLLPELEQVEMMDLQYSRDNEDLYSALPGIYEYVLEQTGAQDSDALRSMRSAIQPMLSFVLNIVLRSVALQICRIQPPLSSDGRQQLAADVDYIASVVSSFTSSAAPEFEGVRRALLASPGADGARSEPSWMAITAPEAGDIHAKISALLDGSSPAK